MYPLYLRIIRDLTSPQFLENFLNINFSANREPTAAMANLVATFLKFAKARNIFHFTTQLKYSNPRTYLQVK